MRQFIIAILIISSISLRGQMLVWDAGASPCGNDKVCKTLSTNKQDYIDGPNGWIKISATEYADLISDHSLEWKGTPDTEFSGSFINTVSNSTVVANGGTPKRRIEASKYIVAAKIDINTVGTVRLKKGPIGSLTNIGSSLTGLTTGVNYYAYKGNFLNSIADSYVAHFNSGVTKASPNGASGYMTGDNSNLISQSQSSSLLMRLQYVITSTDLGSI